MEPNPLREIRDIRRQISEECGGDPQKVFDYYLAFQEKMKSTGKFTFANKPSASTAPTSVAHQSSPTE